MERKENGKYYKLGDNRSMDSSLLISQALIFSNDWRRRRRKLLQAERLFLSSTL